MGDGVRERIVQNNHTFRDANERIHAKAGEYDAPVERVPFLCECPVPSCTEILRLTLAEYEGVRANPNHFFTAPGHEHADAAVAHVVSRKNDYVIVEKDEEAREE
jgi:hypothetical protein